MTTWTDKDSFKLIRDTHESYFHVLRPGVLNVRNKYAQCGDILPIRTNGDVITQWWSTDTINAQPITRNALAGMIRRTKPKEDLPALVVSIPDIKRADIGMVVYCWMHLNTATTMQMYQTNSEHKTVKTYTVPASNGDPVHGFDEKSLIKTVGIPRIYYDWREALTPITNYVKTLIKYCKDTGKTRRLVAEGVSQALDRRNETTRMLVSKNNKRFKDIEF